MISSKVKLELAQNSALSNTGVQEFTEERKEADSAKDTQSDSYSVTTWKTLEKETSAFLDQLAEFISSVTESASASAQDVQKQVRRDLEYVKDKTDGISTILTNHSSSIDTFEK